MRFLSFIIAFFISFLAPLSFSYAQSPLHNFAETEKKAKDKIVYFNAWGGDTNINSYIHWISGQVDARFGITLQHVKLEDTAFAVGQVVAEKAAGRDEKGTIDLIWINGENFASMKKQKLLLGQSDATYKNWAERLPNWAYVDVDHKPTVQNDFTEPTEGLEAPWGMAHFIFYADQKRVETFPQSARKLLQWAKENPGRLSYPQPPDFLGSTFLKQVILDISEDQSLFQKAPDPTDAKRILRPLWAYLDELHPLLWRKGAAFPKNNAHLRQLFSDGEIDIGFAFQPPEASAAIKRGDFPDSVRSFIFDKGSLGNTHFLAIPYNAPEKEAALVVANFMMSVEAQLEKQKPSPWGDFTVLSMDKMSADNRRAFENLDLGVATLLPSQLTPVLPEPHADWMSLIEEEWLKRYGTS